MLESCHRGFQNIVELLVQSGAELTYIPSDEESFSSPFVSAPAQSALAESSRCGFMRIVQVNIYEIFPLRPYPRTITPLPTVNKKIKFLFLRFLICTFGSTVENQINNK